MSPWYLARLWFVMHHSVEPDNFLGLGSLTFDKDDCVPALQAADVIAWAVRRRATGYEFNAGFEPIEATLNERGHTSAVFRKCPCVTCWQSSNWDLR